MNSSSTPIVGTSESVFEGVFHLLTCVLEIRLGLVGLAFAPGAVITGGLADSFLGLACDVVQLVLDLVSSTHAPQSHRSAPGLNLAGA